jgi:hypothetical protein
VNAWKRCQHAVRGHTDTVEPNLTNVNQPETVFISFEERRHSRVAHIINIGVLEHAHDSSIKRCLIEFTERLFGRMATAAAVAAAASAAAEAVRAADTATTSASVVALTVVLWPSLRFISATTSPSSIPSKLSNQV